MIEITPALTAEEWAARNAGYVWIEPVHRWGGREYPEEVRVKDEDEAVSVSKPHATAALCLYGQPYGFTERDLYDIDICLLGRDPIPGTHLHRLTLLRDRIAALLPPVDSL